MILTFWPCRESPKSKQTLDKDVINYCLSIGTIPEAFGQGKPGSVKKY
jgi:hypothetical protein